MPYKTQIWWALVHVISYEWLAVIRSPTSSRIRGSCSPTKLMGQTIAHPIDTCGVA